MHQSQCTVPRRLQPSNQPVTTPCSGYFETFATFEQPKPPTSVTIAQCRDLNTHLFRLALPIRLAKHHQSG
uniref:Uncharacterized protein n=1 Tax=Panagrellus redivivus TaxID=6233 RepID=A0A7E4VYW7_PANRE